MTARAQVMSWWRGRNGRERLMLAVMLASLAAFALWFGVLWPARALRDSAQDRYDRAVSQLRETQASAGRIASLQQALPTRSQAEPASRTILDSAASAGIGVSRQRQDVNDRFVVEIDSATPQALFAWLETLRRERGLAPQALKVERLGAGVRAELAFSSATP